MGISGLHRLLAPHCRPLSLAGGAYRGRRVGVDGMAWLHRGMYSCSREILQAQLLGGAAPWGQRAPPYVRFFMKMVEMLRFFGVCPVIVFDGCELPAKRETNGARRARREDSLRKVRELAAQGQFPGPGLCSAALSVTKEMVHEVCTALRLAKVETIVAPYEADAQLGYLSNMPEPFGVAAVVSEDSDLVAYGCRRLIFKLDAKTAQGLELCTAEIFGSPGGPPGAPEVRGAGPAGVSGGLPEGGLGGVEGGKGPAGEQGGKELKGKGKKTRKPKKELSLAGLTERAFVELCVMSGCDYLKNIKGIGVMKALALLHQHGDLPKAVEALRQKGKDVPADYETQAFKATLNFTHARVFCPEMGVIQHLSPDPLPALEGEDFHFLGCDVPTNVVPGVVSGRLRPVSPFSAYAPLAEGLLSSIRALVGRAPGAAWGGRYSTDAPSALPSLVHTERPATTQTRRQPFRSSARQPRPEIQGEVQLTGHSEPPRVHAQASQDPRGFAEIEALLADEARPCETGTVDEAGALLAEERPVFGIVANLPSSPISADLGRSSGHTTSGDVISNPFSRQGNPLVARKRMHAGDKKHRGRKSRRHQGLKPEDMERRDTMNIPGDGAEMAEIPDTAGPLDDSPAPMPDTREDACFPLVNFVPDSAHDSQETCLPRVVASDSQETCLPSARRSMLAAHEVDIEIASPFLSGTLKRSAHKALDTSVGTVGNTKVQQKNILSFFSRRP